MIPREQNCKMQRFQRFSLYRHTKILVVITTEHKVTRYSENCIMKFTEQEQNILMLERKLRELRTW